MGALTWCGGCVGCVQLEACVHPFFDELRDPNCRLPNGRPLPPLFNFKPQGGASWSPVRGRVGVVDVG